MLSVAEWYNAIAKSYESLYGEEQRNKVRRLYKIYKKLFGERIFNKGLDVGCGIGISTSFLLSICKLPFACDISKNMIKFARKKVDCVYVVCNGEKLPFKSKSFDVVTCITVLQDTPNPIKMLLEIKRILKDNGVMFLTVLKRNNANWKSIIKKYFQILWFEEEEKDLIFVVRKKDEV